MGFSPEQIRQILAALDAVCASDVQHEQRRTARQRCRAVVDIIPCRNGDLSPPATLLLGDFSAQGVGLVHVQPMNPGDRFLLRLPGKGGHSGYVPCRIANCTQLTDGSYRLGAEFDDLLPPDDEPQPAAEQLDQIRRTVLG